MTCLVSVLVQLPAHSRLSGPLTYTCELALAPGSLVLVPLGARKTLGIVWDRPTRMESEPAPEAARLKAVSYLAQGIAPLDLSWRKLLAFAAGYYQRSLGEMVIGALPAALRQKSAEQLERALRRKAVSALPTAQSGAAQPANSGTVVLSPEQTAVMARIAGESGPFLLHGSTSSGKTEVYLRCIQQALDANPDAQALIMVPEINLTPQLEARVRERFDWRDGAQAVVSLHSGLTPAQRLKNWLAAHREPADGGARIVLGTRMAIFASLPRLQLIVVDEEHDPSYKQQDGARHSARDLAIYRGRLQGAKVLLASATPSLESWHHSRTRDEGGRYTRLSMPSRIGEAAVPRVLLVDMRRQPAKTVISAPLLDAIQRRIVRNEQVLLLLNRRGYAPVLHCAECDWKSDCPNCSAYRVFHKIDRSLRCHHCSLTSPVPRACPTCGNPDISAIGRGTERLEEQLAELLQDLRRVDGTAVRLARIDADSTRGKGSLESRLASVHEGDVDVVVGTQMIAKGHDFRRVTLVAAVNPDSALFSSDFRAPERLFSLLLQAAGRAGRDASHNGSSEMWIQTFYPQHSLFQALRANDFPAFAAQQLKQRAQAGLPPFSHQALLRAEAHTQQTAHAFLALAAAGAADLPGSAQVTLYPAIPMSMQRVARVERAHMLVESRSRSALQLFLSQWQESLHEVRRQPQCRGLIRWAVDVDPLAI